MRGESTVSMEEGNEGWLFIAWAFGQGGVFEELATKLVFEIKTNEKGVFAEERGCDSGADCQMGLLVCLTP